MAELKYQDFCIRYNHSVSLAVEKEHGIPRSEYFAATWNLPVESFVVPNPLLVETLKRLNVQSGVLTAAPRIWAERVLEALQVREIFGQALFTGDPDTRKPDPKAFEQFVDLWKLDPEEILSIGDQEFSDILPAQAIGMKTLRIAKNAQTQAEWTAPDVISALKLLQKKGIL